MNPLISVIVPIYNVEKYLPKCIDSIINQTYENLEIILVDDGSPDNCGKLCDEYRMKDSRVKVIHKTNGGLSDARNVAIDIMNGNFVTFIDSDDYVSYDYVETLYSVVEKFDCEMSISQFIPIKENVIISDIRKHKPTMYCMNNVEALRTMLYQEKFDNSAWGKLYKTTLFKTGIRYPSGINFEDILTTYRLIIESDKVGLITKKTYFYLLRNDSIEREKFSIKKMQAVINIDEMSQKVCEKFPELKKATMSKSISVYFNTILQMPKHHDQEVIIWTKIKKYRIFVLVDRNARKKARLASLVSYMGVSVTRQVFRLVNSFV